MHHLESRLWPALQAAASTIGSNSTPVFERNFAGTNPADKPAGFESTTNARVEEMRTIDIQPAESIRAKTWKCDNMFYQLKTSFMLWAYQVKHYLGNEVIDLNPQEYCIFATFLICIGFVLLSGRR